ncbi:MAG: hypothetical protein IJK02_11075 [Clostridia bacterium]|nr:hypothetical protein [Clostridia bacterium]
MKKIFISIFAIEILLGALLVAFILKDGQISAAEGAAAILFLLQSNAVSALLVSRIKKNDAPKEAPKNNNLRVLPAREAAANANAALGRIA